MTTPNERDYVLGTGDEEIQRLGLQHRVWRPTVLDCWRRAGIKAGSRVLDVGAGPGYATLDLAEVVGAAGRVVAVERSHRFVEAARNACAARGLGQVEVHELDLMTDQIPARQLDAAWCRWVASFVSSPATLVEKLAGALRPGGAAVFHEYVNYATWRLLPSREPLEQFVQKVRESWRASGGEPDIGNVLPSLLTDAGFQLRSTVPRVFCVSPADEMWQWPASFLDVNLRRLLELGYVDENWVANVQREFGDAASNPRSLFVTPMVLEIIAERAA